MKKSVSHHHAEIKRFNPSVENGLDVEDVVYMQSVGKINVSKSPANQSHLERLLKEYVLPEKSVKSVGE